MLQLQHCCMQVAQIYLADGGRPGKGKSGRWLGKRKRICEYSAAVAATSNLTKVLKKQVSLLRYPLKK